MIFNPSQSPFLLLPMLRLSSAITTFSDGRRRGVLDHLISIERQQSQRPILRRANTYPSRTHYRHS